MSRRTGNSPRSGAGVSERSFFNLETETTDAVETIEAVILEVTSPDDDVGVASRCCFESFCPKALLSKLPTPGRSRSADLIDAAERGALWQLRRLLNRGVDVEIRVADKGPPLCAAARGGHLEAAQALLHARANPETASNSGWTPLMYATSGGHTDVIQALLDVSTNSKARRNDATTALMLAGEVGFTEGCQLLIDAEADVNASDELGTVLDRAVAGKQFATVEFLRNQHAMRSSAEGARLGDALLKAAREDRIDEVHRLLLDGADVDFRDALGGTNTTPLIQAAHYNHMEVCRLLIQEEADVNASNGVTALIEASANGYLELVYTLLSMEADVNFAGRHRSTSLALASKSGHADVVQVLLEERAEVDIRAERGRTPLMLAASAHQVDTGLLLLEFRANVTLRDDEGRTALDRAIQSGSDELAERIAAS